MQCYVKKKTGFRRMKASEPALVSKSHWSARNSSTKIAAFVMAVGIEIVRHSQAQARASQHFIPTSPASSRRKEFTRGIEQGISAISCSRSISETLVLGMQEALQAH